MFIGLIFIFQVALIFQGFDLSDEGFLSTFYRRFYSNPNSVSYNFMFWLTGVIGGAWSKLVSPLGLLGIRLGGAIVNTLTVILTFQFLKKYLKPDNLKLGLLLVILSLNNDIKVLNYNTLSSLFYILTIVFLFLGLLQNHLYKLFLAGLFGGLNIFIRTPNVLELGLVLAMLYHNHLTKQPFKKVFSQIFPFLAGYLAAIGLVMTSMYLMGHLPIFLDSMKILYAMGKGQGVNTETQGGYGISRLLYLFRSNTIVSIKYASIVLAGVFGILYLNEKFKTRSKPERLLSQATVFLIYGMILALIITHRVDHFTVLFTITGLSLLTAVFIMFSDVDGEIKLLFFLGFFFLLSFPLGSSDGIYTAGRYCLWIALPMTIDYLLKWKSFHFTVSILGDTFAFSRKIWLANHVGSVKKWLVFMLVFSGFYFSYFYPFFDRRNRVQMHYALQSDNLKGIYTTKGRAEVFNELLRESKKYIKENEYVIAYDDMAMYYYATNTIPQLSNPLPAVYSTSQFQLDLNSIFTKSQKLPPVVRQKIATIGDASKWPEEISPGNYFTIERNLDKNEILDSFLLRYRYKEVWANRVFMILLPDRLDRQADSLIKNDK